MKRLAPGRRDGKSELRTAGLRCTGLFILWMMQAAASAAPAADAWLANLVQRTVTSGQDARISPHLSKLLGLSATERDTPVRQLGILSGTTRWLFNVCVDDHKRLVLMRVEADKHLGVHSLSVQGAWLRGVVYDIGGETRVLTRDQSRADFLAQRDFWMAKEHALDTAR